jgi:hypothetical protein
LYVTLHRDLALWERPVSKLGARGGRKGLQTPSPLDQVLQGERAPERHSGHPGWIGSAVGGARAVGSFQANVQVTNRGRTPASPRLERPVRVVSQITNRAECLPPELRIGIKADQPGRQCLRFREVTPLGPQDRELAEEIWVIRAPIQRVRKRFFGLLEVLCRRGRKCRPESLGGQANTGTNLYAGELPLCAVSGCGLLRDPLSSNPRGAKQGL